MTSTHGHLFTAGDAARACGVARTTISRAAAAGKIAGAERDENGAWVLPLAGLLAAGFNPGKPSPPEDAKHESTHRDDAAEADVVPRRVYELEKELADTRGEARAQKMRADELANRVADLEKIANAYFQLQIEARAPSPQSTPAPDATPAPDPTPTPKPVAPPVADVTVREFLRAKRDLWRARRRG